MRPIEVLVVEDNPADRFWLEYTIKMLGRNCTLSAVTDGEQAVNFLLKRGTYSEAPTPDLIFLDVQLPRFSGIEILRQLPDARNLPICVLTSSETERSAFQKEFGIQDSDYVLKPVSHEKLRSSTCCLERLT